MDAAERHQMDTSGASTDAGYQHVRTLEGHHSSVAGVKFKPDDGAILASCSADGTIKMWKTETGETTRTLKGHKNGINDVAWSQDCRYLCSASDDQTAMVWDAESGKQLSTLSGHSNFVFSIKFSPAGNLLVSGSFDETVRVWDARTSGIIRELPAHSDPVTSVDINQDGTTLVSSSFDGLVRIWDTSNGKCLRTVIDENHHPVSFTRFTPNGRYLLVATLNGQMALRNCEDNKIKKVYRGYQNQMYCLVPAISCTKGRLGGRWLVTGSEDNGICVWEINKRELCQKIEGRSSPSALGSGHCDVPLCVDAHPTQTMIASGAGEKDSSIRLWRASE
ncbi:unnamed protein product [Ostreobium quekettii]|uniref:WDR5-like beta-propeller domain-containing protein n=1 Tax=Ostreobium quekettii TaxID=121088 RepID=A0A8S1IXP5_9CHLO|nr:unnamed protein product [Ostreobium quekettii]|eukprot:evm.model.scf_769.3 EVM.evm.TU.scf_769.3   scf_769:36146-39183(-)